MERFRTELIGKIIFHYHILNFVQYKKNYFDIFSRFTVNLMRGTDFLGLLLGSEDRPLHISVRFQINIAVRNTLKNDSWGSEERYGFFPFAVGNSFSMTIQVERSAYKVSTFNINDEFFFSDCDFPFLIAI